MSGGRVCVIGAGPCGLTALKNLLQAGCCDVVSYEEGGRIGGNWAFTDDPRRAGVYESAHIISSRRMSSFDDFPMPRDYPDFPSHRQVLAYFTDYAETFQLARYIRFGAHVEQCTLGDAVSP
jgi:cation diffusion facilitator CzcD-associated flavoprotein CzcO